jgi:hypothetical protein
MLSVMSPTSSSNNGHGDLNSAAGPPILQSMLSQLAFRSESISTEQQLQQQQSQADEDSNFDFLWRGLFCFSRDSDEQLFYDAVEELEENSNYGEENNEGTSNTSSANTSSTHSDAVFTLRAGEAFTPAPNLHERSSSSAQCHHNSNDDHHVPDQQLEQRIYQQKSQEGVTPHQPPSQTLNNNPYAPLLPPPPPQELPERFLRAGKGDTVEGQRRYDATLEWRREHGMDTILTEAHPNFEFIKKHYPHYYHERGRNGEPVFFEQPPKTDLKALKAGGVTLPSLLHHYAMVTEFQWQCLERDDFARSITVLDLGGMRMYDFVGECVEYVRKCSAFTGQNYPERAGFVLVVNVPGWFAMIWNVVRPMVDEVTLNKITILRGKKDGEVLQALLEKIPMEHIPPEYGGQSQFALGESPQEVLLRDLMRHNNHIAEGDTSCGGRAATPPCPFCSFAPARSY